MTKTIIYIGGFELPDKNAAAHRVLNNAKIFRSIGYKIVFIGIDKSLHCKENTCNKYHIQDMDVYSFGYPNGSKQWVKYLTDISAYTEIINKYDNTEMVILYNFQSIAMRKFISFCKRHKIRCCADVTEWRSTKGENFVYRVIKDCDTWYRMTVLHKKLDGLIVISKYLQEYYKMVDNVVVIPTLVDLSEKKWINNYSKSEDELVLVYAGNPGNKDKIDVLIESVEIIKRPCRLDIIGISKEQCSAIYPRIIDKRNLRNTVFHGRLSHRDTLEYIKKSNYSCFFREDNRVSRAGFPTKLAEALSCGTPVLTNVTGDIGDYLSNENSILIQDVTKEQICYAIESAEIKKNVNVNCFDYHNYIELIKTFIENMTANTKHDNL